jgi:putative ABC transport system permease protein
MLLTAFRDLQFRRRRVAIAVIGTALVFALSLVMSGISASFGNEVRTGLGVFGADGWLRPSTANGAIIATTPFAVASAPTIDQLGVDRADPMVFRNTSVGRGERDRIAYFGVVRGGLGDPNPVKGRRLQRDGEIVLDKEMGRRIGDSIRLGGTDFKVVGLLSKRSIMAGVPLSFMSITDAQRLVFGGQNLANSFAVQGTPTKTVKGWTVDSQDAVETEMLQPLGEATKTINLVRGLLWLVAALIIGSVMYLQALERTRDFAVLKSTGASSRSIGGSLAVQALVLSLVASLIALVVAALLAPQFPMNVEIPKVAYITLPIVAVVTGLVAVLTGLRRSLSVEPAFAFRGA